MNVQHSWVAGVYGGDKVGVDRGGSAAWGFKAASRQFKDQHQPWITAVVPYHGQVNWAHLLGGASTERAWEFLPPTHPAV